MDRARRIVEIPDVVDVLRQARTVAVLGAHVEPSKPAHYVPAYLHEHGYRVLPVNPRFVGESLFGETVAGSLVELRGVQVDVVDVFRRSEDVPSHLDEILGMEPLPRVVWLQSGIRSEPVADRLVEAGIDVIQDRCMLADHRRLTL